MKNSFKSWNISHYAYNYFINELILYHKANQVVMSFFVIIFGLADTGQELIWLT